MDYSEFLAAFPDPVGDVRLAPLAMILKRADTSMIDNPVFWTRVVGYAYLCQQFIERYGQELEFTKRTLNVRKLVAKADDAEIHKHADEQEDIFSRIIAEGL